MLLYKASRPFEPPHRNAHQASSDHDSTLTPQGRHRPVGIDTVMTEYAAHAAGPSGQVRYIRRARHDAPEWYGRHRRRQSLDPASGSTSTLRDGHKHRRLSQQMVRVCTRALEKQAQAQPRAGTSPSADAVAGQQRLPHGRRRVSARATRSRRSCKFPASPATLRGHGVHRLRRRHHRRRRPCTRPCAIGLGTQPAKTYAIKIKRGQPARVCQRLRTISARSSSTSASMLDGATFNKAGLVDGHAQAPLPRPDAWTCDGQQSAAFTLWDRLQIICCGDFMQLPPVQVKDNGWILHLARLEAARVPQPRARA